VLEELEKYRKGITREILVLELVNKLKKEGEFLTRKVSENLDKYMVEFEEPPKIGRRISKLEKNPLLISFLGKPNIRKIVKTYDYSKPK